jgi:hypothetical protein
MSVRRSYVEIVFLHSVGSAGHVVHCGASGAQNVDTLFLLLVWDQYRFLKEHAGTHYTKLMFLHSMGYAGHVVHSGVSGV